MAKKGIWSVVIWRGDVVEHRHYCASEEEAVRYAEGVVKHVWFNSGLRRLGRRRWANASDGTIIEVTYEGRMGDFL